MKKTLIVSSILAAGVLSSMGQGQINANDGTAVGVFLTVSNPNIANGVSYKVGNTATAAGFPASVGPGQITVSLYAAPNGTSLASLTNSTPIVTVLNSASALAGAQGTFSAGSALELTTAAQQASTGGVVVAGWDGSSALEFIFKAVSSAGDYVGWSAEGTAISAATGINTPTPIFGTSGTLINSFAMVPVPEPTTLALGGLGAASLLLLPRRK